MNIEELAIQHRYYASPCNYFSNDHGIYETMTDFINDFRNEDIDMNLIYRWDVFYRYGDEDDESKPIIGYRAQVTIIHQRRGIYNPCTIKSFEQSEVDEFVKLVNRHKEILFSLWSPL